MVSLYTEENVSFDNRFNKAMSNMRHEKSDVYALHSL